MNDEMIVVVENEASNQAPLTDTENNAGAYTADNVQMYRDAAHIRQRPGMYIGDTSTGGLHQLAYELVYNSVDEALRGALP